MGIENSVTLIGRLTRDPELRYVPSGDPVANFSVAVDRPFTDSKGEQGVDFIDIVAWKKLAENTAKYTAKGKQVGIQGRLQIRTYETQDGQKRKVAEVVAHSIKFLSPKNGNGAHAPEPAAVAAGTPDGSAASDDGSEDQPF